MAAINTGKLVGADIVPIDTDAQKVLDEMWSEMSFKERMRYRMSGISDSMGGSRKVQQVHSDFAADEDAYIESMRKRYPTLVRKLIDERNQSMAEQINAATEKYDNIVVVVGDAHVEGICKLLHDPTIRKIRLNDLMDEERLDGVRNMVRKGEESR
jgi:pheromone shutdown protein TraB